MIEISIWKIFLVLIVALVVLGPEQLPKVAKMLGRLIGQLKGAMGTVQKEINQLTVDPQDKVAEKEKQQDN